VGLTVGANTMTVRARSSSRAGRASSGASFVAAVSVFVFRGDRLLALRRAAGSDAAPGAWDVVSGRVEPNEHPHDAARRECREETGLDIEVEVAPIAAYTARRLKVPMLVVAYRARSEAGDVVLSEEHDDFAWMTLEAFAMACPFPPLVVAARLAAGERPDAGAPLQAAHSPTRAEDSDADLPGGGATSAATAAARGGHVIVWEFRVRAGREAEFESAYGPDGDWARLFRRDPAYHGTDLLRDGAVERRYVTIDRWASRAANDAFRERWRAEYEALDRRCEALTEHEAALGRYDSVPTARGTRIE
jgi:8-oxo-dGTP pyrophosphatase MutT (NUDIX family)/quinol monooxygenase YgiN